MAFNENAATLGRYATQEGYDWPFAGTPPGTLREFNIRSQASYVGIGPDGTIVASSGGGSGKNWTNVLNTLRSS